VFKRLINRRETFLLIELLLDGSTGLENWFICCDPVLKLCQRWFTKDEVFCGGGVEPLPVVC
jgi:hypothetical protein